MLFMRIYSLIGHFILIASPLLTTLCYAYSANQNTLNGHVHGNSLISQVEQECSLCAPVHVQDNLSVRTSRTRRRKRINNNTQLSSTTNSLSTTTNSADPAESPILHTIITNFQTFLASDRPPQVAAIVIERLYDVAAIMLIDLTSLDEHDLVFQLGAFSLEFHCFAEYLSVLVLRMIVRRLGQLVQKGMTGLVAGEVVDVKTAVRTTFVFGVGVRDLRGW